MKSIIAFAGQKGSGKDTCADYLVEHYGYTKYAFATPIKDICRTLFDLSEEQLYGDLRETIDERYSQTPRQLLQKFGTDFCRDMIDQEFWINYFKRWAKRTDLQNDKIVISDVRFQNEMDAVNDLGGRVFAIKRPGHDESADQHVSEQQHLIGYHGIIHNDGTIDSLVSQVKSQI